MKPVAGAWVPPQSSLLKQSWTVRGGIADFDDADLGGVFLAKDGHRAALEGLRVGEFEVSTGRFSRDAAADEALDVGELLGRGRFGLGVVEAQVVGRDERAGLADVLAEHVAEGGMEQVGGGVVAGRVGASGAVDVGLDLVADGNCRR